MNPPLPQYPPLHLEPPLAGGWCARTGASPCASVRVHDEGLVLDRNTLAVVEAETIRAGVERYVTWTLKPGPSQSYRFPRNSVYGLANVRLKLAQLPERWQGAQPDKLGRITVWIEAYGGERAAVEKLLATEAPALPGCDRKSLSPVQVFQGREAPFGVVSFATELAAGGRCRTSCVVADGRIVGSVPGAYPEVRLKQMGWRDFLVSSLALRDEPHQSFTVYQLVNGKVGPVFRSDAVDLPGHPHSRGWASFWDDDGRIAFTPDRAIHSLPEDTLDRYDRYWILKWNRAGAFVVERRPIAR